MGIEGAAVSAVADQRHVPTRAVGDLRARHDTRRIQAIKAQLGFVDVVVDGVQEPVLRVERQAVERYARHREQRQRAVPVIAAHQPDLRIGASGATRSHLVELPGADQRRRRRLGLGLGQPRHGQHQRSQDGRQAATWLHPTHGILLE